MYVKSLKIQNIRSIKETQLDLNIGGSPQLRYPNVNVIVGGNGLGKTSVLRSVALSVLGPLLSASSGFISNGLIRRERTLKKSKKSLPPEDATVEAKILIPGSFSVGRPSASPSKFTLKTRVSMFGSTERLAWDTDAAAKTKDSIEKIQFDDLSPEFFIVGYGATRRVESSSRVDESARRKARLGRYQRVAGLFEEHVTLMPLSFWLPRYFSENPGRYKQVITLLNELLPDACQIDESPSETEWGKENLFVMNGVSVPFSALSDGYRAYIGWIGDMLFHVCMRSRTGYKLRAIQGIVLVDEIDLHLHPEWQQIVVPTLAKAFPRIQFIVTTHSPLVVGSLEAQNLFVLQEEGDGSAVRQLPEKILGRSAEQILLSPYFGLDSTRPPETAKKLADLARRAASGDASASLDYLKVISGAKEVKAFSPRQKAVLTAAKAVAIPKIEKKLAPTKSLGLKAALKVPNKLKASGVGVPVILAKPKLAAKKKKAPTVKKAAVRKSK